jgi:four helix bundle protein
LTHSGSAFGRLIDGHPSRVGTKSTRLFCWEINGENGKQKTENGLLPYGGCMSDNGGIRDFKNLKIWQVALDIVDHVYRVTATFPRYELWGLSSQLRRAAVSIPSNIAEGHGKGSKPEYIQALLIARGSMAEVETQLLIAVRLGYMENDEAVFDALKQCYRLLHGLIKSLKANGENRRTEN